MGKKNSSLTRVQPVFDALLDRDATGRSWLPDVLGIAPRNGATVAAYRSQPDGLLAVCSQTRSCGRDGDDPRSGAFELRGCFERQIAAWSSRFTPRSSSRSSGSTPSRTSGPQSLRVGPIAPTMSHWHDTHGSAVLRARPWCRVPVPSLA